MKKILLKNVCLMIAVLVCYVIAVEPNSVTTTTYDVDGNIGGVDNDPVSIEYSDGLGRVIQSKLRLGSDKDRVSCTMYDEAGRTKYATKPFIDILNAGSYLPGEISDTGSIDNDVERQLFNAYNDTRAYAETRYWDDPLGRVRTLTGAGAADTAFKDWAWTFGVVLENTEREIPLPPYGTVKIRDGVIIGMTPSGDYKISEVLDQLHSYLATTNPFSDVQTHFLMVSLTIDGVSGKEVERISEEVKDLFGRTIRTFSGPAIRGVEGSKISAAYTHDILGNTLTETPPDQKGTKLIDETNYRYNTLGQLRWKRTPDAGVTVYDYYDNGLLMSSVGNDTRGFRYYYDALGRVERIDELMPGQSPDVRTVTMNYYDDATALPSGYTAVMPGGFPANLTNLKGRLASTIAINYMNSGKKSVKVYQSFSYDDEGRVSRTSTYVQATPFQESRYAYDIHGNDTADVGVYGNEITGKRYAYDKLGRLSAIYHCLVNAGGTTGSEKPIARYEYDDLGIMTAKNLTEADSLYNVGYAYDIRDRLTAITKPAGSALKGFSEVISRYTKSGTMENAGYRYFLSEAGTSDDYVMSYTYDDQYRLTAVRADSASRSSAYEADFAYDEAGRFTTKKEGESTLTGYAYYPNLNRLKCTNKNPGDGREYIYDKSGNLVVDMTKKMVVEYDWRNLPVMYRFYAGLSNAGITRDTTGTCTNSDLYGQMNDKVIDGSVQLVSTVVMAYDAGGKRICKMDIRE